MIESEKERERKRERATLGISHDLKEILAGASKHNSISLSFGR